MGVDLDRAARAIEDFLAAVGAPAGDPELAGTGMRVAETYARDLLSGYGMSPAAILADTTESSSRDLVVVAGIRLSTTCPHHLMPATGIASVGYAPGERVVGLGAIARLVDCFSRRLALQEDIGSDIVGALVDVLGARAAGCVLVMSPTCMTARAERRYDACAVSHAWAGAADAAFRSELLAAAGDVGGESGAREHR